MTWANGRITERKQDDGIGNVSIDWVENSEIVCTYSHLIDSAKDKAKFKAAAIKYKNDFIARQAKETLTGTQIANYMNQ